METKNTSPRSRTPIYKRRKFWAIVFIALVIAVGIAAYFLNEKEEVDQAELGKRGTVVIDTEPDNATITVDGKERKERSDTKITLPVGKHEIKVELAGYDEAVIPVEVESRDEAGIAHTFTKQGSVATQSEFKNYRNDKYGYSLRYPARLKIAEQDGGDVVVFTDTRAAGPSDEGEESSPLTVLHQPNPQGLNPTAFYRAREEYRHEDQSQIKQKPITVAGRPAYEYKTPYGFRPYLITILTEGTDAFLFQQGTDSPYRKMYDQILKSLKFE